jgi:hypothetical protein
MNSFKCDKGITLEDCELAILRMAVDKAEEKEGMAIVNSPEVKNIINIVEEFFLWKTNLFCLNCRDFYIIRNIIFIKFVFMCRTLNYSNII